MAYAVSINGSPKVYNSLPKVYHSSYANVLGGFDTFSDEELAKHGFYPVEEATITDPLFEEKSNIYFDEANKVFKYNIRTRNYPNVETLKEQKIEGIESQKKQYLSKTNNEVLESLELGEQVPTEISASRADIRTQYITLKSEINTLNTQRDLLTYTGSITI